MRMTRWVAMALIAGFLAFPAGALGQGGTPPSASPVVSGADVAGLVDIGDGRRLYLECHGSGGPTVVLEAGYRSPAAVWIENFGGVPGPMVFQGVAMQTRVCLYERPGVAAVLDGVLVPSRSDPAPVPRTARDVVEDLHTLLDVAGEQGPFVLVGHSFGGLFVRLYATTWPGEVAGLVLVDALSEAVRDNLSPADWAAYAETISAVPPELASYADLETVDVNASFDEMTEALADQPLTGMPVYVIAAGLPSGSGGRPGLLAGCLAGGLGRVAGVPGNAHARCAIRGGHRKQPLRANPATGPGDRGRFRFAGGGTRSRDMGGR